MRRPLFDTRRMHKLLEDLTRLRILVVGDLMLDHYVWGDATRLSPEAPVPIVKVERDSYTAGGAANVAANLRALGVQAEMLGTLGADAFGDSLRAILRQRGAAVDESAVRSDRVSTIVKTRVMCRSQQLCRLDREGPCEAYALSAAALAALPAKLAAADAVILSDYAKGVITSETIRLIQGLARPGQIVALDPKPRSGLSFSGVSLMTPNKAEALQLAGLHGAEAGSVSLAAVASRVYEKYAPRQLVITLGGDGMLLCTEGRPGRQIPTAAREVFDVSGAGDTVIATLAVMLARGAAWGESIHVANIAAGIVVGKLGTAVCTRAELEAALKS